MPIRTLRRRVVALAAAGVLVAGGAIAITATAGGATGRTGRTELRTPSGTVLGTVKFEVRHDSTAVALTLRDVPSTAAALDAFHGFHIHANDNPANGADCVADPSAASTTWFVSADGHWSEAGQTHGGHVGDLPSVLLNADGSAELRFTTARVDIDELARRAVILHAGPDNFGNVPVGAGADQYQPNSAAATTKTAATGNSGDRIACGVIRR